MDAGERSAQKQLHMEHFYFSPPDLETRKSNPKELFSGKESYQGINMEKSTGADVPSSLKEAWGYAEIKEDAQDRL